MAKERYFTKRIVAGKFKGKELILPSKKTTRSSKAIVLESFFNTIQFDIIDATFVEVFSGSGSIGLEALSRGAKEVLFMEKDKEALRILKHNIDKLDPNSCEVYSGDSFITIDQIIARLKRENKDAYFYIDPPFSIREGFEDIYDNMIELIAKLPKEIVRLITIEHMTGLELPQEIGPYSKKKSKKFGKTSLTYYNITEVE
ncbi:Ribosomal RNA small subunit methyltransferase D [hydrothermal vent metagenome]|uniref:Ribosomal RNA small subunit methyltransferase D n=1 Tax=hydrothermal vent metagenome TaxID=652676 RepID=A0A1W1BDE1_9ZZZZ